jgi:arylformamidase
VLLDFSHAYTDDMLVGGTLPQPSFSHREYASPQPGGRIVATDMCLVSHVGTHIDAPIHFVPDGARIGDLPLEAFTGHATVAQVKKDPGEPITVDDILSGGPEPSDGDMLIINTGWWRHYVDRNRELYLDAPPVSPELAVWAVERRLKMVATDTVSPDPPATRRPADYPMVIHHTLLSAGVLIAENLHLERATAGRYEVFAFPMLTVAGDGGPTRFAARRLDP